MKTSLLTDYIYFHKTKTQNVLIPKNEKFPFSSKYLIQFLELYPHNDPYWTWKHISSFEKTFFSHFYLQGLHQGAFSAAGTFPLRTASA